MAYSGLAAGLLGAASGAGDDAERRMKLADETAAGDASMQRRLMMELEMKDQYAQRVAERANAYDTQVNTKATGLLAQKDQSNLSDYNAALASSNPDNPQLSMDEYKQTSDYKPASHAEELQAKIDSSTGTARKEYQAELTAHNKDMNEQQRLAAIEDKNNTTRDKTDAYRDKTDAMLTAALARSGNNGKDPSTALTTSWKFLQGMGWADDKIADYLSESKHKTIEDIASGLVAGGMLRVPKGMDAGEYAVTVAKNIRSAASKNNNQDGATDAPVVDWTKFVPKK